MSQIDELRKAQLKIAQEIRRVCEKYNLKYFLDGGTMLGAIRHKGFIPWDDDIDLGMPAIDYKKFLEIAPSELGKEFFIDNYNTNKENGLVFTKIRLLGTCCIEAKGNANAEHNEVFVDVFPYYSVSDNRNTRKVEALVMSILAQALMSKSGYRVWKGDGFFKRVKFIPTDIIGFIFSKKRMHKWIDKLYHKHKDTKDVCIHGGCFYNRCFDKEWINEFIDAEFEGDFYKIPKKYHEILSFVYGDYMVLPPEDKRVTHQYVKLEL